MENKYNNKILLIDKPEGISSFDVIRKLRKIIGIKKMGHSGTLDPFASGLLLIATGNKTKEMVNLIGLPKKYEATILFGQRTDTLDPEGIIIDEVLSVDIASVKKKVLNVLPSIKGVLNLSVPIYSAVHVEGKRLYQYAREGKKPSYIPKKDMIVNNSEILKWGKVRQFVTVDVLFHVESGTYIRTLAEHLGDLIGIPSMLIKLRRTEIGEYSIKNSMTIE